MANKLSEEYARETSCLQINAEDMHELAVSDGQSARITSPYGEVTVTCHPANVPRGVFFLPLGPLANQLFSGANTEVRRVVWPSRTETLQTTLAVLVVVLLVGIFLWLLDMLLLWAVQLLTGQGG